MKTPQNDGLEDTIQLDLSILPKDKRLQFGALATKKAKKLVRKQLKSDTRKGHARVAELLKKAEALDTALAQGEEAPRGLWPDDLDECISILTAFSVCLAYSAEKHLLEMSPEEMDAIGGVLNAFTAKEHTCYYAKILDEDLPLWVPLPKYRRFKKSLAVLNEFVYAE